MTRIRQIIIVITICAASYSLPAQDIGSRVEAMDARGMYAETLA